MKIVLFLLISFFCIGQAQKPIPVTVNTTAFGGYWYIVWQYNSQIHNESSGLTCPVLWIDPNGTTGSIYEAFYDASGVFQNFTIDFEVNGANNSVWTLTNVGNVNLTWIDVDVTGYLYAAGAFSSESGFIISRTASIGTFLIDIYAQMFKKEGYNLNTTNQVNYNSTNCYIS